MAQVNPDPHQAGYVFEPTGAVTAFFPAGQNPGQAVGELSEAGFAQQQVEVFSGPRGASQLDLTGEKHGAWVEFQRRLEGGTADEAEFLQRADQLLRNGGFVVAAFTNGDENKKELAARILRAHKGYDIIYWGEWTIDRL
jgi:hypothetical protein